MENEKRYKKIVQLYQRAYPDLKPQTQHMGGGLLFRAHADRGGGGGEIFVIFRGRHFCMTP